MTRTTKRRSTKRTNLPDFLAPRRGAERIRQGRVLSAQARIASGYYDRPEVKDCLVDVLLRELSRH